MITREEGAFSNKVYENNKYNKSMLFELKKMIHDNEKMEFLKKIYLLVKSNEKNLAQVKEKVELYSYLSHLAPRLFIYIKKAIDNKNLTEVKKNY